MQIQGAAVPMQARGRQSLIGSGTQNLREQRPQRESSLSGLNLREKVKQGLWGMLGYGAKQPEQESTLGPQTNMGAAGASFRSRIPRIDSGAVGNVRPLSGGGRDYGSFAQGQRG